MQAAEYRERLRDGADIAEKAMQNGAAVNGRPAASAKAAARSGERAAAAS
jgi:hypothetical protein